MYVPGKSGNTGEGAELDGATVVTFTWKDVDEDPFNVTVPGTDEQVANDGAPVQVRATVPANPLRGETCKLYVAVFPAITVAAVEPPSAAAKEKSAPFPVKATT